MDCVERRKYNPEINGVSVPTSGRVTCYCEKGMRNRTSSSFWKSCFLLFPGTAVILWSRSALYLRTSNKVMIEQEEKLTFLRSMSVN